MMRKTILSLVSHPFLRSSAVVTVLSFVASIFSYFFNLVVVKFFPVASYGEYAAANSYIGLLSVPIIAFGTVVIRRIGREKKEQRQAFISQLESWIKDQLIEHLPWLSIGVFAFWVLSTRVGNLSTLSVGFVLISLLALIFHSFYGNVLQSLQYFGQYGSYLIFTTISKLLVGVLLVTIFHTLLGLYVAILGTTMISIWLGRGWAMRNQSKKIGKHTFSPVSSYLKSVRTLVPLLTMIGLIGLSNADVIIAKALLPATQAGLYGTLSLISKIILFVTTPIGSVSFVFFTDNDQESKKYHLLAIALGSVAIVGLVAIIGYALLPTLVIRIIASASYLGITSSLWAGALFGTLYSMVVILGNFFISKNNRAGVFSLVAVVVQVILLLFFHASFLMMMLVNAFACFLLLLLYAMVIFTSAH